MYRFQGSHIARSEVCLIADDLFIIPNVACFVNTFFEVFFAFCGLFPDLSTESA
jgi:hypothetical protein